MYVRRSSLRSCYSQPLLSYVPPCAIADTCERCLHTATVMRQRPHGGRSFRVALFSINAWAHTQRAPIFSIIVWAHTQRAPTARPIKANYLKIVTIRPLIIYKDPVSVTSVATSLPNMLTSLQDTEINVIYVMLLLKRACHIVNTISVSLTLKAYITT